MSGLLLRGELFKAGDGNSIYKLRWFELLAAGKGELRWSETDGAPGRAISELYGATVTVGLDDFRAGEARYGFQILPRGTNRAYALQVATPCHAAPAAPTAPTQPRPPQPLEPSPALQLSRASAEGQRRTTILLHTTLRPPLPRSAGSGSTHYYTSTVTLLLTTLPYYTSLPCYPYTTLLYYPYPTLPPPTPGLFGRGAPALGRRHARLLYYFYYPTLILPYPAHRPPPTQASSAEERRLWVDAIETMASPHVQRSSLGGVYRLVQMRRPEAPTPWGLDLGSAPGLPCVTVLEVSGEEARCFLINLV